MFGCIRSVANFLYIKWLRAAIDHLSVNIRKYYIMTFSWSHLATEYFYEVSGKVLAKETCTKDLRITCKFSFRVNICETSFKLLGFVTRNAFRFDELSVIYVQNDALIRSIIKLAWNPQVTKFSFNRKLQKNFLIYNFMRIFDYCSFLYYITFFGSIVI